MQRANAPGRGPWLSDISWQAALRRLARGDIVLLPIGAGAKAHGPHLPLGTDQIVVEAIAERTAALTGALIAPTATLGYYPAFVEYPASQHIPAELFQDLLVRVMARLIDGGARKLAILNNGVSTEGPAVVAVHRIYADTGVRPAVAHLGRFGRSADSLLDDSSGGHADERETSMMLALRPDLVDMAQARAAPPEPAPEAGARLVRPVRLAFGRPPRDGEASADGALGDPRAATAAKGSAILDAIVSELAAELDRIFGTGSGP